MSSRLGRIVLVFSSADYELLERPADVNLTHVLGFRVEPHPGVEPGVVVVVNGERALVGAFRLDR